MLRETGEVWVLDFDRGRLRELGAWREGVLNRLARSLAKITAGGIEWQGRYTVLRRAHDG